MKYQCVGKQDDMKRADLNKSRNNFFHKQWFINLKWELYNMKLGHSNNVFLGSS